MTLGSYRPVGLALALLIHSAIQARADVVTEWDIRAGQIVVDAKLGAPMGNRVLAIVQTAVFEAANAISGRYPASDLAVEPIAGASIEAAVATANQATLSVLVPSQKAAVEAAYQTALAQIPDGPAKNAGIAVGERAASAVLAARADDGAVATEGYRPRASAGVYVPTTIPAVPWWPRREPWLMKSADQFRPDPPPALSSELWARDYNEIKAVGGKDSSVRTPEETEIARFWETTMPPVYHGIVRSVADQPGRDITQNARLFAAVMQAADDALIAVFDAKYRYEFWRPITAIRNGDLDGNDATERDSTWTPFIETPMHPEYPCAHCIVSSAIGAVLRAEIGSGPTPRLTTTSPTADGAERSWSSIEDCVREVANARIYDGVHFRNSTEVGAAMGVRIGELAVAKFFSSDRDSSGEGGESTLRH